MSIRYGLMTTCYFLILQISYERGTKSFIYVLVEHKNAHWIQRVSNEH